MADYWKTIDTILMGRKTWSVSAGPGGVKSRRQGRRKQRKRKRKNQTMRTYVFSRTLRQISAPGVTLVTTDAANFVRSLKQLPGKGICLMGGGEFARSLFEADLVDEVGFNIHPILLGSGIPAFLDPGHTIKLELTESRVIDGGCVLTNSRAKH